MSDQPMTARLLAMLIDNDNLSNADLRTRLTITEGEDRARELWAEAVRLLEHDDI